MGQKENLANRQLIEQIALDYIVNELSVDEIVIKYKTSKMVCNQIIKRMRLDEKKDTYRRRLLSKSLDKCANYQSKIIVNATELLHDHVENVSKVKRKLKREGADALLTSNEVKEMLAILTVISKERRLDSNEATERIVEQVEILFPEGFAPITLNATSTVISEEPEVDKNSAEVVNDQVEVEVEIDDDIMGGLIG